MNEGTPSQAVARALKTANLVDTDGRPLCTFHGLRHTCATAMLTAGIPLITVSRFLGHADPSVTAQVYAHLVDPTQFEKAAAVFEEEHPANTLRETLREDS